MGKDASKMYNFKTTITMKAKLAKCGLVAVMTMAVSLGMASCEKSNSKPVVETQTVTMAKDNAAYEAAVKDQLAAMQRGECKEMTLHLEQTDDSYILTSERHNKK